VKTTESKISSTFPTKERFSTLALIWGIRGNRCKPVRFGRILKIGIAVNRTRVCMALLAERQMI
jgi:hypothetical protein